MVSVGEDAETGCPVLASLILVPLREEYKILLRFYLNPVRRHSFYHLRTMDWTIVTKPLIHQTGAYQTTLYGESATFVATFQASPDDILSWLRQEIDRQSQSSFDSIDTCYAVYLAVYCQWREIYEEDITGESADHALGGTRKNQFLPRQPESTPGLMRTEIQQQRDEYWRRSILRETGRIH